MSFYSYKNANPCCCPGTITNGSALDGLRKRYACRSSAYTTAACSRSQLDDKEVTITSYAMVANQLLQLLL